MLKRLWRWVTGIREDPKVVWKDDRGPVTHKYIFEEEDRGWRSRCISWPMSDKATIEYNIPRFADYGATEDHIYLFLVEDTLHELTHWATNESDYSNHMSTHWENWRRVLYDEIEYVHEEFEIRY